MYFCIIKSVSTRFPLWSTHDFCCLIIHHTERKTWSNYDLWHTKPPEKDEEENQEVAAPGANASLTSMCAAVTAALSKWIDGQNGFSTKTLALRDFPSTWCLIRGPQDGANLAKLAQMWLFFRQDSRPVTTQALHLPSWTRSFGSTTWTWTQSKSYGKYKVSV